MSTHTTLSLPSGTIAHHWKPPGPSSPRAILILQHGFGEYAERYATSHSQFIPRLLENNIEVWALDLQGHGQSPGIRGVVDVHGAVKDHAWLVGFIASGAGESTETTEAAPSVDESRIKPLTPPILLFGHSLGGLVTAGSATALLTASQSTNNRNPIPFPTPRITGLILTGPILPFPNVNPNSIQSLLSLLASLLLRLIAFFFPHREVPSLPGSNPPPADTLRGDDEAVQLAEEDEMLFRGGISWTVAASAVGVVSGVWRGIRSGLWARNGDNGDGSDNAVNVLVLHGRWDPWSDWRGSLSFVEGIQRSRTRTARANVGVPGTKNSEEGASGESPDSGAKLVLLDTPYHELLNAGGSVGEEALRVLLEWVEARIADGCASPNLGAACEPPRAGQ
ncbi:Alpha/Beta hydrolase protein [Aspergillus carlsbadensis]|nr:Alpha/Beta hydrolase protein [Aspergillus carlsbadensis]